MRAFRPLLLLAALLAAAAPAAAQSLQGRVVDAATGAPVAGVRLTLLNPAGEAAGAAVSDAAGSFRLRARAPGTFRVTAARLGYRTTLTRELEIGAGAELPVELRIAAADPVSLDTARVRAGLGRGVHGVVVDDSTGRPVSGAVVHLKHERGAGEARTRTDAQGAFSLRVTRPGGYQLEVSAGGYLPSESRRMTLVPDDTVEMRLRLSRGRVLLAPVEVVASSRQLMRDSHLEEFEWRRRTSVQGRFLGPEEIRRINPFYTSDVLQEVPFVRVVGRDRMVALRGSFGLCIPTVYVDGHRVADDVPINEIASGTRIAAVEVYDRASQAPPEFQPSARKFNCGVVVLWTQAPGRRS